MTGSEDYARLVDENARLAAELKAALCDAERYRWLRIAHAMKFNDPKKSTPWVVRVEVHSGVPGTYLCIGDKLDAAVDEAIIKEISDGPHQ